MAAMCSAPRPWRRGSGTSTTASSASRSWRDVAVGSLLSAASPGTLRGESQVLALRAPLGGGHKYEVGLLLFARPAHWLRRAASIANLRATQEFKLGFNDSAANTGNITSPLNVRQAPTEGSWLWGGGETRGGWGALLGFGVLLGTRRRRPCTRTHARRRAPGPVTRITAMRMRARARTLVCARGGGGGVAMRADE